GCWCAEALVFFRTDLAKQLPFIRKRAAQLFSKTRFIAAQFHAYLDNDLWIDLARHANKMAVQLVAAIGASAHVELAWPCQSNELFVTMPTTLADQLKVEGVHFYPWPVPADFAARLAPDHGLYRLVTSFATEPTEVDRFKELIG
ncbi:MAG: low specificity L-threonine aldolase, partial [Planctomycetota bacterium]